MDQKDWAVLASCPLFFSCDREKAAELAENGASYTECFPPKSAIPFRSEKSGRIGVILEGEAEIYSAEGKALLNRISAGSVFGVSSLYSQQEAKTRIVAKSKARVLFFEEDRLDLLLEDKAVRRNLIAFLTGRIRFLNEKITSFSAGSAEKKLALFLMSKADENGIVPSIPSYSKLAGSLGIGRASLYRVLEKMEREGIVEKEKKTLRILSRESLQFYLS